MDCEKITIIGGEKPFKGTGLVQKGYMMDIITGFQYYDNYF